MKFQKLLSLLIYDIIIIIQRPHTPPPLPPWCHEDDDDYHLVQENKGFLLDKFEGTRNISRINRNSDQQVYGTMVFIKGQQGRKCKAIVGGIE